MRCLILLCAFMVEVFASAPLYKADLQKLALDEEARLIKEHTDAIIADFYSNIVDEARLGYTDYVTRLSECPATALFNAKPAIYDAIIQRVFAELPQRFPDADITYNEVTNLYTVSWL